MGLSRREFAAAGAVAAGAAAGAALPGGAASARPAEREFRADPGRGRPARPNILVVLGDDLGWADLGSYGSPHIRTPHLDRLAREGVRFTQGYS
ncbi:twin-arginine translocation pathway signal protein, partial [Actinomadura sp. KC216]|uniref:sulfatase-like hydrolase/transferase n=1 Tax=Actinomadura sp. KC216 TaxID=2530370 RepID=UPI0010DA2A05